MPENIALLCKIIEKLGEVCLVPKRGTDSTASEFVFNSCI